MTAQRAEITRVAYRFKEAQRALGIGEHALRELLNSGQLRYSRIGNTILIPAAALEEMLQATLEDPRYKAAPPVGVTAETATASPCTAGR